MKKLKFLLNVLLLVYFGLCMFLYIFQDSMIFESSRAKKIELLASIDNVENIVLQVEKDIKLFGKHKILPDNSKPLVIYFGGNASDITSFFNHTLKV